MKLKRNKILIIIMGIAIVISLNFFQKEVKGFFYSISSPVQKNLWQAGDKVSDFFESIFGRQSFKKENEELKLKIQELFYTQNLLKGLEEENKMLREALGLNLQKELRLEIVDVMGKDANRDTLLINKGSKDGLYEGLFLITSQKVLIGNIIEVYQNYSKVLLISDKESSFEAKISSGNVSGLAKGLGKSRIFLDLIPKDAEIKEGDLVVSRGFLIGLIKEVRKIDVSPFQGAEISPFFSTGNLNKAFVVLDF